MKKTYRKPQVVIAAMNFEEHILASGEWIKCIAASHWYNRSTSNTEGCQWHENETHADEEIMGV